MHTDDSTAVNKFFSKWYRATEDAFASSLSTIDSIVRLLDPIVKTKVALNDVVTALTFGLALIAGPEFGGLTDEATQRVSGLLVTLIQQTPGLAKGLWPLGTSNSQLLQISELSVLNQNITTKLEEVLNGGLQTLEGNVTQFLSFVAGGVFSGSEDQQPTFPDQTQGLLLVLTTFVVSTALAWTGWDVVMLPRINPY